MTARGPRLLAVRLHFVLLAIILAAAGSAGAQTTREQPGAPAATQATREMLTAVAEDADRRAADEGLKEEERREYRALAEGVRERLREGDFRVGDRIMLEVRGDSSLTDTFVVRAGPTLQLPNMTDI